jgi:hypothetical protein
MSKMTKIHPKCYGHTFFHFFQEMRALWSEHIKNKVFEWVFKEKIKNGHL